MVPMFSNPTSYYAVLVGILAHIFIFKHGEWHMKVPQVLFGHVLVAIVLMMFESTRQSVPSLLLYCSSTVSGYLLGLFSSIVIYRLSPTHRLYKFPGPKLAAISKVWHVWMCRDSRNHQLMWQLHEQYGDFVRIGPSELASFHPDTFVVLEGFGTQCTKSDFYDLMQPDFSLVFTRNKQVHDARRNVWSNALSTNAISSYQRRINRQVGVLIDQISAAAIAQTPVPINDLMYMFAFDSMGEFAFNQDFGMMQSQEWHFAVTLFRRALSLVGPFASIAWLIRAGFTFVPWFWKIGDWFAMLSFCNHELEARLNTQPEEKDITSFFIEEADKNGHSEDMRRWLKGDAATVVVAGRLTRNPSDTTAPSLTFLLYCLAKHPEDTERIYTELAEVDPFDLTMISSLSHFNGAINEAMRLYSVAPTTVSRQTPRQGVMLGDRFIPGDTKVLVPRWVIFNREDCFTRSTDFIPERWYSKPELVKNKRAFSPFGKGRASCVGQGLAMTQIRLVLASLVKGFRIHFPPGDDGRKVLEDMKDQLTAKPGPLRLMFSVREPLKGAQ